MNGSATVRKFAEPATNKKFELENLTRAANEEDRETLAAIDPGIADAKAGMLLRREKFARR